MQSFSEGIIRLWSSLMRTGKLLEYHGHWRHHVPTTLDHPCPKGGRARPPERHWGSLVFVRNMRLNMPRDLKVLWNHQWIIVSSTTMRCKHLLLNPITKFLNHIIKFLLDYLIKILLRFHHHHVLLPQPLGQKLCDSRILALKERQSGY